MIASKPEKLSEQRERHRIGRRAWTHLQMTQEAVQASGVPLGIPDDIEVISTLRAEAFASGPLNATADFIDTFAITKVQLFNSTGALLDDNVTLTDAAGNVLPVSSPAVPEPSSALLLAAGIGLLVTARRARGLCRSA